MTRELDLRLAGGYYFRATTRIIRDLQPLLTLEQPTQITIDMSDLTFMGPTALALTAATIYKVLHQRLLLHGSIIRWPRSIGIYRYLHRMDFLRLVLDDPELEDQTAEDRR
ncbi:MAG: hypothetical protein ACYCSI_13790 [Solirubrobacteraceae bacterium]